MHTEFTVKWGTQKCIENCHWARQSLRMLQGSQERETGKSRAGGGDTWLDLHFKKIVVQLLNHVQLFGTPWTTACQTSPSFTISWNLLKLMSIESVMLSNHFILCHPHLLLPSVFCSIRIFSNEMALRIRWLKFWCFSFSISPSSEYSGLISFRINWFDVLAVQGTLKSLLQHHSSKT